MATDAERRAAVAANRKRLDAKRGTRSDASKKAQVESARTTAGVLFFMLPAGRVIRVLKSAKNAIKGLRARGAKPISKPTATQISNAKPPTQAQIAAPKSQAALPKPKSGGTTPLTSKPKGDVISGTAREVKPGTSVVPSGSRAVKNPGTGVQRVVRMKDKPKEMKQAQRADKRVTGSAAKPKKKSKALRNTLIAAAALGGGYLATRDGDKTPSASTTKPTPKKVSTSKSRPTRKNLGTVTARKVTPQKDAPAKKKPEAKKAAPSKVISAGPNTGFGPKGNIFPGNAEERAGYMKMYGGTGSAAAKAAAAGKQGDMKAGRAAVDAAKKKRLSKKKD
jgi:hypothetical protein